MRADPAAQRLIVMRPRGTFGPVARALLSVWERQPCTVRDAAMQAQVGIAVARVTASRLLQRGLLIERKPGRRAVLMAAPRERHSELTAVMTSWRAPSVKEPCP